MAAYSIDADGVSYYYTVGREFNFKDRVMKASKSRINRDDIMAIHEEGTLPHLVECGYILRHEEKASAPKAKAKSKSDD